MAGRIPLVIKRGYKSTRILLPGPFGMGTTFNYETEVEPVELAGLTGAFSYSQASGRSACFSRQPDGTSQNTPLPFLRGVVLTLNADGTRTVRKKNGTLEQYNANGRLIAVQDPNGNAITIQRDSVDHILYISDPGGRVLHFTYDGGRIGTITDPIGRVVTYTYNVAGDLASVTDAAGGVTRYTYDANGLLLAGADPRALASLQNE